VPTISEAGVTGYEAINWWGLVAPAGTPPAVIERVHSEIGAIQRAPDMQRRFEAEAVEALQMSPAQFGKYMQDETAKWARVVRDANIQAQ
jgi:tripartite-type tricarboxylate transporter receptor subunit TctC